MRNNYKLDRLSENIKYSLNNVINDEVEGLEYVTVVDVDITKDLGDAKIYYQTLDGDNEQTYKRLEEVKAFLKKRLAQDVQMRRIPNLIFKYDDSLDNYNKINDLLDEALD